MSKYLEFEFTYIYYSKIYSKKIWKNILFCNSELISILIDFFYFKTNCHYNFFLHVESKKKF